MEKTGEKCKFNPELTHQRKGKATADKQRPSARRHEPTRRNRPTLARFPAGFIIELLCWQVF